MIEKKEKKILGAVIVLMIIALLVLCAVLVRDARSVGRAGPSSSLAGFLSARRARGPLAINATNANLIRPWMTFDYINRLFDLPKNYLKTSLNVSDGRYPNVSISEYRESTGTSSVSFLDAVRSAILSSTTTPQ